MKRAVQPILGVVARPVKPLTPSQRELVRRAGTHLSPGQRMTARRQLEREWAEAELRKVSPRAVTDNLATQGIVLPKLRRIG